MCTASLTVSRATLKTCQQDSSRGSVRTELLERYQHPAIHRVSVEPWLTKAPYEFGAGTSIVVIGFQAERAQSVRIRTADGLHIHPLARRRIACSSIRRRPTRGLVHPIRGRSRTPPVRRRPSTVSRIACTWTRAGDRAEQ